MIGDMINKERNQVGGHNEADDLLEHFIDHRKILIYLPEISLPLPLNRLVHVLPLQRLDELKLLHVLSFIIIFIRKRTLKTVNLFVILSYVNSSAFHANSC